MLITGERVKSLFDKENSWYIEGVVLNFFTIVELLDHKNRAKEDNKPNLGLLQEAAEREDQMVLVVKGLRKIQSEC